MNFYTYIVRCSDGTFYTGYTDNPEKRLATHNAKKWAKYTRGRTPVTVVFLEKFPTKSEAMKREHEIKQFSRTKKEQLIIQKNQKKTYF